jgi:ubiquinone/menaquinone biosynthesis C-methylase UbiE
MSSAGHHSRRYWDRIAAQYQEQTWIACDDFHYGPLLPGDRLLQLLPKPLSGLKCLELGCGGAQNSIYLATRGACCYAVDISAAQLRCARRLAAAHAIRCSLVQADLDALPWVPEPYFDIVHSSYALPFLSDQKRLIDRAAKLLQPGGLLLLATAHPLATAEWLELEDGERGAFIKNYYAPTRTVRRQPGKSAQAVMQPVSLAALSDWLDGAGLQLQRLLEPAPVARARTSRAAPLSSPPPNVPYWSLAWEEHRSQLEHVPGVVIVKARKR